MKINLLIVDDEQDICEMLSRHFRYLGFNVQTASNGKEALDLMAVNKIDIVISDIVMPVMDGAELCARIRADYPLTHVIMITGHVTLDNVMACMRRGADLCVFKPLHDLKELEEAVNRAVEAINRWINILTELRGVKPEKVS